LPITFCKAGRRANSHGIKGLKPERFGLNRPAEIDPCPSKPATKLAHPILDAASFSLRSSRGKDHNYEGCCRRNTSGAIDQDRLSKLQKFVQKAGIFQKAPSGKLLRGSDANRICIQIVCQLAGIPGISALPARPIAELTLPTDSQSTPLTAPGPWTEVWIAPIFASR